jgi:hypothetical protein
MPQEGEHAEMNTPSRHLVPLRDIGTLPCLSRPRLKGAARGPGIRLTKGISRLILMSVSNVTQLNLLAGEGVARVQRTRDGARLKVCVVNATTLLMLSDTVKATNFWLSMLFSMCFINVVSGPFSL